MQNSLPQVVTRAGEDDPAMDSLWHQIYGAFIAKSATANPDKLPNEAFWGGFSWIHVVDGSAVKFVRQGQPDAFMSMYAGTSIPDERNSVRMRDSEADIQPFTKEGEKPARRRNVKAEA